ncbi:spore cortex biosynthesis protein YabQ [Fictibacillus iocasae]|uniref:Spore cortex biosynthesis protein YabQ n=1 Tax=Fictibacillus iocasae TaxID=2715437 RepID=A0ABW2NPD7_9BACL
MTLTVQFQTIISMVAMGIWIGMAMDTYGRFLHEKKKWNWFHFINDFLFWVLQALLVFYVLLKVNHAEVRFYIFLALLCGFSAYKALFEKTYKRILERVIIMVSAVLRFFRRLIVIFLINPVKWLLSLLVALVTWILTITWRIIFSLLKILFLPFKWTGLLIWRFIPKQKWYTFKDKLLKQAGFLRSAWNKAISWFKK